MKKNFFFYLFLSVSILSPTKALAQNVNLTSVYTELKSGNYEEVITKLSRIRNKEKKFLSTKYYLLGLSHSRLQNYDDAKKYYIKAVKVKNRTADLYYELGQVLYALNELEQSRKAFILSEKKGFNKYQSNYYIGHISQLLDENKRAKLYFSKILKDKEAPLDFRQIARFQLSESLLELARNSKQAKAYVRKYILPQMNKALNMKKIGATARDIQKRIAEIKKEFGLDPNLLVNGKRIPQKRYSLSFSQKIEYDNNFTYTDDLPSSQSSKRDTYIFSTNLGASKTYISKRKFIIKPTFNFDYVTHSDRESDTVFSSDSYTISPSLKNTYEHKAFKKPASFIFDIDYDYVAKDRLAEENKIFNNRNITYTFGEKFKYFNVGNSTVKFKYKSFRSYDETLDNNVFTFSFDQLAFYKKKLYILLLQLDTTNYINNITNNTKSFLARLDYLYPNILPRTTLNLALSSTFLSYDDQDQSETKGLEKNLSFTGKLTKSIRKNIDVNANYTYTKNISKEDASNYTKHSTFFEIALNY